MADMMPTAGPDQFAQIRAMLGAAGVRPTTENLNRAMLAIAQQRPPAEGYMQGGENEQTEAGSTDNEQVEGSGGGGIVAARRGSQGPAASRPGMAAWDGTQYDPGSMGMGAAIGGMPQQSAAMLPQQMPMDTELPVAINHANEYNNMPQGAAPGMMPAVEAALGGGAPTPMASANMNGPMDRRGAEASANTPQGPRTLSDMRDAQGNPLIMDPRAMIGMASPMKLMQASELLANLAQRAAQQGVAAVPQGARGAAAMSMRPSGGGGVLGADLQASAPVTAPTAAPTPTMSPQWMPQSMPQPMASAASSPPTMPTPAASSNPLLMPKTAAAGEKFNASPAGVRAAIRKRAIMQKRQSTQAATD